MKQKIVKKTKDVEKKPRENVKKQNVITQTITKVKEKRKSDKFATFRQRLTNLSIKIPYSIPSYARV